MYKVQISSKKKRSNWNAAVSQQATADNCPPASAPATPPDPTVVRRNHSLKEGAEQEQIRERSDIFFSTVNFQVRAGAFLDWSTLNPVCTMLKRSFKTSSMAKAQENDQRVTTTELRAIRGVIWILLDVNEAPILTPVQKVVVMHLKWNQKKKKARRLSRTCPPKEGSLTLKGGLHIE